MRLISGQARRFPSKDGSDSKIIPDGFIVPTCDSCNVVSLRDEDIKRLVPTWDRIALEEAEVRWRKSFNFRAVRFKSMLDRFPDISPAPLTNEEADGHGSVIDDGVIFVLNDSDEQ